MSLLWITMMSGMALGAVEPEVRIARNFTAEYNETLKAIPEQDKAWPLYIEAIEAYQPWDAARRRERPALSIKPGHEDWPRVEAWLAANAVTIERVVTMAAKPCACVPMSDALHPVFAKTDGAVIEPPSENPVVGEILLPLGAEARVFSEMLYMEARRASHAGDAARVEQMLLAMLGMADHWIDAPMIIEQLVGRALVSKACDLASELVEERPGSLTTEGSRRVAQRLAELNDGEPFTISVVWERVVVLDLLQRWFTDDGQGDGTLTLAGYTRFRDVLWQMREAYQLIEQAKVDRKPDDEAWPLESRQRNIANDEREFAILGPRIGSRKEQLDWFDALMAKAASNYGKPFSQVDWASIDREQNAIADRSLGHEIARLMYPPTVRMLQADLRCNQHRDATIVVLALGRFHAANGRWPASWEELAPELPIPPRDLFTGEALLYILRDGEPRLYARGIDQDDDRGVPMEDANRPFGLGEWWNKPREEQPSGDWILFPTLKD